MLNSGEVIAGDIAQAQFTAVGHSVGTAQRLEAAALRPEFALLPTARLVEDATRLGSVEDIAVKGADAPVSADSSSGSDLRTVGRQRGRCWEASRAGLAANRDRRAAAPRRDRVTPVRARVV